MRSAGPGGSFPAQVTIHNAPSTDFAPDQRYDVVVAEVVDAALFGEGALATLADAARRLAAPGATIVPRRATLRALPVASDELRRQYSCCANIPQSVAATPRPRRGYPVGDESRRRRGRDVEISRVETRARLRYAAGAARARGPYTVCDLDAAAHDPLCAPLAFGEWDLVDVALRAVSAAERKMPPLDARP